MRTDTCAIILRGHCGAIWTSLNAGTSVKEETRKTFRALFLIGRRSNTKVRNRAFCTFSTTSWDKQIRIFVENAKSKIYDLLSHSRLLLSAIKFVPWQTPFASAETQAPSRVNNPGAQTMQSFAVGPVHVWQVAEHRAHAAPLAKLPLGQTTPLLVVWAAGLHLVASLASFENPDWQTWHAPVPSAHVVQPIWQTGFMLTKRNYQRKSLLRDSGTQTLTVTTRGSKESRRTC